MSYRLSQLSPQVSTHGNSIRVVVVNPRHAQLETFADMEFWRSWIEHEAEAKPPSGSRVNWNAILGFALTAGISAAFWIGAALLIAQIWK